jgi:hypothetical protein
MYKTLALHPSTLPVLHTPTTSTILYLPPFKHYFQVDHTRSSPAPAVYFAAAAQYASHPSPPFRGDKCPAQASRPCYRKCWQWEEWSVEVNLCHQNLLTVELRNRMMGERLGLEGGLDFCS